ncbi:unnamed protein product [Vitrella brassicaformis CCMP3155]|uniref:Uncharacterized protein n=1 Tax=Vitrella brassicaformis (strain CCMP3155) TaxID=1169540 RepID=A0A0G4G1U7_VITBC|nr:unnamed protein product [Vitrella brassicaformis CCMP3155]|eukprot:CEM21712.1 unnamed protein product [Vitrella brassicaformis CCMP3155]
MLYVAFSVLVLIVKGAAAEQLHHHDDSKCHDAPQLAEPDVNPILAKFNPECQLPGCDAAAEIAAHEHCVYADEPTDIDIGLPEPLECVAALCNSEKLELFPGKIFEPHSESPHCLFKPKLDPADKRDVQCSLPVSAKCAPSCNWACDDKEIASFKFCLTPEEQAQKKKGVCKVRRCNRDQGESLFDKYYTGTIRSIADEGEESVTLADFVCDFDIDEHPCTLSFANLCPKSSEPSKESLDAILDMEASRPQKAQKKHKKK